MSRADKSHEAPSPEAIAEAALAGLGQPDIVLPENPAAIPEPSESFTERRARLFQGETGRRMLQIVLNRVNELAHIETPISSRGARYYLHTRRDARVIKRDSVIAKSRAPVPKPTDITDDDHHDPPIADWR